MERREKKREREADRYKVLSHGRGGGKKKQRKQFCVRESGETEEVR